MEIIKTANGKHKATLSKNEWLSIGKKAGWVKEAISKELFPLLNDAYNAFVEFAIQVQRQWRLSENNLGPKMPSFDPIKNASIAGNAPLFIKLVDGYYKAAEAAVNFQGQPGDVKRLATMFVPARQKMQDLSNGLAENGNIFNKIRSTFSPRPFER